MPYWERKSVRDHEHFAVAGNERTEQPACVAISKDCDWPFMLQTSIRAAVGQGAEGPLSLFYVGADE